MIEEKWGASRFTVQGCLVAAILLGGGTFGCGGAQQQVPASCEETFRRLIQTDDAALCEPESVNRFEIQVLEWREACPVLANSPEDRRMGKKLETAQTCSDTKRHLEQKHRDCDSRLTLAQEGKSCLGKGCLKYWNFLRRVHVDCETPELKGEYVQEIGRLKTLLEERTTDGHRIEALGQLAVTCDRLVATEGEKRARAAMDEILDQVAGIQRIREVPTEGSELQRSRKATLDRCDHVLTGALSALVTPLARKLDNRRLAKSPTRWKRQFKKLTALYERIAAAEAVLLFPEASGLLKAAIGKYDPTWDGSAHVAIPIPVNKEAGDIVEIPASPEEPQREKPVAAPIPNLEEDAVVEILPPPDAGQSQASVATGLPHASQGGDASEIPPNPYGPETAAQSGASKAVAAEQAAQRSQIPRMSQKKCQAVKKRARQLTAKVNEYKRKGNEKKLRAYTAKLLSANQKLEAECGEIPAAPNQN